MLGGWKAGRLGGSEGAKLGSWEAEKKEKSDSEAPSNDPGPEDPDLYFRRPTEKANRN